MSIALIFAFLSCEQCGGTQLLARGRADGSFPGVSVFSRVRGSESGWSAGSTPSLPTTPWEPDSRGRGREFRNGLKLGQTEREGLRSERHGPPQNPAVAWCFFFPSPLCCHTAPWRAARPGGPGGSQAAARQTVFKGGCREKERKRTLGAERKGFWASANPCENRSLEETRAGVQEPGPRVLSHESANSTAPPCRALWERVVGRWGDSWEPGGALCLGTPPSPQNGQRLSPVLFVQMTPGYCSRVLSSDFWRGRQAVQLSAFGLDDQKDQYNAVKFSKS